MLRAVSSGIGRPGRRASNWPSSLPTARWRSSTSSPDPSSAMDAIELDCEWLGVDPITVVSSESPERRPKTSSSAWETRLYASGDMLSSTDWRRWFLRALMVR